MKVAVPSQASPDLPPRRVIAGVERAHASQGEAVEPAAESGATRSIVPHPTAADPAPAASPAPAAPSATEELGTGSTPGAGRVRLTITGLDLEARKITGRDPLTETEWVLYYAPDVGLRLHRPLAPRASKKKSAAAGTAEMTSAAAASGDVVMIKLADLLADRREFPLRWGGRVIVTWRQAAEEGSHLLAVELAPESELTDLSEGDYDPTTKKVIGTFILSDNGFNVYLDTEGIVHCTSISDHAEYPKDCGEVFNRVTYLETLSIPFKNTSNFLPMRRFLGEAVARMISEGSVDGANYVLDRAEPYLQARRAELARIWYLYAAGAVAAVLTLVALGLWLGKTWLIDRVGIGNPAFDVLLTGCCGGIGAFMFVLGRSSTIHTEAGAGRHIHLVEGVARVIAGVTGGVVVSLAVQADILSGLSARLSHPLAFMLGLGLAAGASERLVPNLVGKFEASTGTKERKPGAGADAHREGAAGRKSSKKSAQPAAGRRAP
jgi:hypothetical protein